jgi:hypothetical protein
VGRRCAGGDLAIESRREPESSPPAPLQRADLLPRNATSTSYQSQYGCTRTRPSDPHSAAARRGVAEAELCPSSWAMTEAASRRSRSRPPSGRHRSRPGRSHSRQLLRVLVTYRSRCLPGPRCPADRRRRLLPRAGRGRCSRRPCAPPVRSGDGVELDRAVGLLGPEVADLGVDHVDDVGQLSPSSTEPDGATRTTVTSLVGVVCGAGSAGATCAGATTSAWSTSSAGSPAPRRRRRRRPPRRG